MIDARPSAFGLMAVTETAVSQATDSAITRCKDLYGIDAVMLKDINSSITYPFTKTINMSFGQSSFPSLWKSHSDFQEWRLTVHGNLQAYQYPSQHLKIAEKIQTKQITNHLNATPYTLVYTPVRIKSQSLY